MTGDAILAVVANAELPDGWRFGHPTFTINLDSVTSELVFVVRLRRGQFPPGTPSRLYAYGVGSTPGEAVADAIQDAGRLV